METPQGPQEWFGRFKVSLSKILTEQTIAELAVYFNFPQSITCADTKYSSLRFVEELHRKKIISPTSIQKLTDALSEIDCKGEEIEVKAAFTKYRQRQVSVDETMSTGDEDHTDDIDDRDGRQDEEMSTGGCEDHFSTEDKGDEVSESMDGEESCGESYGTDVPLSAEWCKVKVILIHDGRVNEDVKVGDAHLAALCKILAVSEEGSEWTDCIGQPVGLYLHEHKYEFQKDKFYRLRQFYLTRSDERLKLVVSRISRISEISDVLLKGTNYEQHNNEDVPQMSFPPAIRSSTYVTVKAACQIRHRCSISSIRGIVFEVNKKANRTTFQLSDDGETSVSVVAPFDTYPSEDIKEKDIVELRLVEAIPERKKMKFLLFDDETEVIHLEESDHRLVNLLDCELVNRTSRLEGTVIECGEAEYYNACAYCFQKKLYKQRNGIYSCNECRGTYAKKDVATCFTVSLIIQDSSEDDIWEGITFANVVNEILKAGYPNEPNKRNENALSGLLVNKKVQFTRKRCDPPLNDVFSKFTFL